MNGLQEKFETWYNSKFTEPATWHEDKGRYTIFSLKQRLWEYWQEIWDMAKKELDKKSDL